jgi:hypothetical protein
MNSTIFVRKIINLSEEDDTRGGSWDILALASSQPSLPMNSFFKDDCKMKVRLVVIIKARSEFRAQLFKRLRGPGIDSRDRYDNTIPPRFL